METCVCVFFEREKCSMENEVEWSVMGDYTDL
jgi:hypothetical protein